MKSLKGIGNKTTGVVLILAPAIPLMLVYGIYRKEMEQSIKGSRIFVSASYAFQKLNYEDSGEIRWLAGTGEKVDGGQ